MLLSQLFGCLVPTNVRRSDQMCVVVYHGRLTPPGLVLFSTPCHPGKGQRNGGKRYFDDRRQFHREIERHRRLNGGGSSQRAEPVASHRHDRTHTCC